MSSFGVAGFTGVRPGGRQIRPGSKDSLGCALGFVWCIRGRWVHYDSPLGSSGSSGVAGLIWVHPAGRSVRPGSLS